MVNAMKKGASRKRDFDKLERRRMKAARLLQKGLSQAEVGRRLKVSRESVRRWWNRMVVHGSMEALKKVSEAGRKARLSGEQLSSLKSILRAGPAKSGFPDGSWTLKRVADVIEKNFGVRYHTGHVSWIIRNRLGATLQGGTRGAPPKKRSRNRKRKA
jgi:transposase